MDDLRVVPRTPWRERLKRARGALGKTALFLIGVLATLTALLLRSEPASD